MSQHGVLTREQALRAGLTSKEIYGRVASGTWRRLYRAVYAYSAAPASWQQSLLAACLALGEDAVASHRSAAALLDLPGFEQGLLELTSTKRTGTRYPTLIVHTSTIARGERALVHGIPCTTPTRTLLDIGAVVPREAVASALDAALCRRLTSLPKLVRCLERSGGRGRRGTRVLRDLIEDRLSGDMAPESPLETKLLELLRASHLPPPRCQYEVLLGGRRLRLDFAYPEAKVAIEADGWTYHQGKAAWQRDLERRNLLAAHGWIVIHLRWDELRDDPTAVVARIEGIIRPRLTGWD